MSPLTNSIQELSGPVILINERRELNISPTRKLAAFMRTHAPSQRGNGLREKLGAIGGHRCGAAAGGCIDEAS